MKARIPEQKVTVKYYEVKRMSDGGWAALAFESEDLHNSLAHAAGHNELEAMINLWRQLEDEG